VPLGPAALREGRLRLPALAAVNELTVEAVVPYSRSGLGLSLLEAGGAASRGSALTERPALAMAHARGSWAPG
jgi:hypothetical protein